MHNLLKHAYSLRATGNLEAALRAAENALSLCSSNQHLMLGHVYSAKGQILQDMSAAETAAESYRQAVNCYRVAESADRVAHALRHIADIERQEGHLQAALDKYLEAAAFYALEENNSSMDYANCARGLALLYEEIGHTPEALDLWKQAREIYLVHDIRAGVDECDGHIRKLS